MEDRQSDFEFMLKRWKRSSQSTVAEYKRRQDYKSPSELKRVAKQKAVARARGGVALSFADMGEVHWSSPGLLNLTTDDVIAGLARMVDAVHAEGMLMFQQLLHGGMVKRDAGKLLWCGGRHGAMHR